MSQNPYGILGAAGPELTLKDWYRDGIRLDAPVRLSEWGGAVKIIYCFQSWCPSCHSSGFPTLERLLKHFKQEADKGKLAACVVQTVFEGFESNTVEHLFETQRRYRLGVPFAHDERRPRPALMTAYRTGGTPWFIILDETNRVIYNDFHIDFKQAVSLISNALQGRGVDHGDVTIAVASDDTENARYTVQLTGAESGFVQYRKEGKIRYLEHSEVPASLRGQSYGAVLMEAVLEKIESQGLKVVPECRYTRYYLSKYKRWNGLLAQA
ncbi:hypothetical protein AB833_19995 [Chromatiales bacterium (ex Bugula neritina AB1)]|nr:hypothetical protein AB833_19995 [Chromatiales bacterium (ex Bugula neritina AB1)]